MKVETSAKLTRQIDSLRAQNGDIAQVSLSGNTDAIGSDAANQLLSHNRCEAVRLFLQQNGVSASRIKTVGKGELAPVANNETGSGRQQNRRVDVEMTLVTKAFVNVLQDKNQEFALRSGIDTFIIAKSGTVFRFRNDVFDVPKGTKLTITIREALTYSDMIFDRLSTDHQKAHIQRFITHYGLYNRHSLDSFLATCAATKKDSKWSRRLYAELYVNTPMDLEIALQKKRVRVFQLAFELVKAPTTNYYFRNELIALKLLTPRIDTLSKKIKALAPKSIDEYREAGIAADSLIKAYSKEVLQVLHLKSVSEIPAKLIDEDLKRQRKFRDSLYTLYKVKNDRQLNTALSAARILAQQRLGKRLKDSLYTRYQVSDEEELNKALAAELAMKQKHWRDSMYIKYSVSNDAQLVLALQKEREEIMFQQNTGYYIAEVTQTGWVNMDRFMGMSDLVA
ncbi:MAG: hypothetical protein RI894_1899, partial [Bacteroidota bacterium]